MLAIGLTVNQIADNNQAFAKKHHGNNNHKNNHNNNGNNGNDASQSISQSQRSSQHSQVVSGRDTSDSGNNFSFQNQENSGNNVLG